LVGIVFLDVGYSLFESDPSFYAHAFIKGQIGFIGDAIRGGSVNDGFVESEDRIFFF
jgi:hypothetical protein